jgi:charged multivesicular body protein 6
MGGIHSRGKTKNKAPKKGGTITPIDRAVLDLKISRDRLSIYRTKLAIDAELLATRAKTLHVEGKTKNALQLLRLRKFKLQEADRVEEQLLTVLRMVDKIAEKQNEQEVVVALTIGTDALQKMHDEMGIDDVLDLMDKVRDQSEVERRINEVLGCGGLTVAEELAEEAVLVELEKLEEELRSETDKQTAAPLLEVSDDTLPDVQESSVAESTEIFLPEAPRETLPDLSESHISEPNMEKVAVAL